MNKNSCVLRDSSCSGLLQCFRHGNTEYFHIIGRLKKVFNKDVSGQVWICSKHSQKTRFYKFHKICADPYAKHTGKQLKGTKIVTESMSKILNASALKGEYLCISCHKYLLSQSTAAKLQPHGLPSDQTDHIEEIQMDTTCDQYIIMDTNEIHRINNALRTLGLESLATDRRQTVRRQYIQLKVARDTAALEKLYLKLLLQEAPVQTSSRPTRSWTNPLADDYIHLLQEVRTLMSSASPARITQLLTLVPRSWSTHQIQSFFNVSDFSVRRAVLLRD